MLFVKKKDNCDYSEIIKTKKISLLFQNVILGMLDNFFHKHI